MRLNFSNGLMFYWGLLFSGMMGLVGCSEELPPVIMTAEEKPLLDTFYIGSVPSAAVKRFCCLMLRAFAVTTVRKRLC